MTGYRIQLNRNLTVSCIQSPVCCPFQFFPGPLPTDGCGFISALQEVEQCLIRIGGILHRFIRKDELLHIGAVTRPGSA